MQDTSNSLWKPVRWPALAYALTVCVGWFFPLLDRPGPFSAALVATVAFFVAGLASLRAFQAGRQIAPVVRVQLLGVIIVPMVLYGLGLLWTPSCGYLAGIGYWFLFPAITVVFAVALAYAISGTSVKRPFALLALIGGAIIVLGPLYDLGLHPQFYTYNHVFGGVLGPIYDEELTLRTGLLWFRFMTILWAALFVLLGIWLRRGFPVAASRHWWLAGPPAVALLALLLGIAYLFADRLGINTSLSQLQRALPGHIQTEHVDLYFDPEAMHPAQAEHWARYHEYEVRRITSVLEVEVQDRIASFLYPNEDTKARLTGARTTNTAPVWLATPQIHVLQFAGERVVSHELAHAVSREFGLPIINASLSIGLVEGLAVALEPGMGSPSVHDQALTARMIQHGGDLTIEDELASDLVQRLSPVGFWTGRGAVSYTLMGSFIRYLLDEYGPAPLKSAYPRANFDSAYGRSLQDLAAEWEDFLESRIRVSLAARQVTRVRFTRPSVFELRCPFQIPPERRAYRKAVEALRAGEMGLGRQLVNESLAHHADYIPARNLWASLLLISGDPLPVIEYVEGSEDAFAGPSLAARHAEAVAMTGGIDQAQQLLTRTLRDLPPNAHATWTQLMLQRLLLAHPELQGIVQPARRVEDQLRLLRASSIEETPAGRLLLGLTYGRAQHWAEALASTSDLIEHINALNLLLGEQRRLEAYIYHQRARWLYASGQIDRALDELRLSKRIYAQMGANDEVYALQAQASFYMWLEQRSVPNL